MSIQIPGGAFGPDALGMGLEIGSNVYKGMKQGETATWQEQQKFDAQAHNTAIQDMANLVEIHGADAPNQPEFREAYQRAHKAQYPMVPSQTVPEGPGGMVPAPLGGPDTSPTLMSLGITDPQLGPLTTKQAKGFGIDVGKLILDLHKPMTESEYNTQLIQELHNGVPMNPQKKAYAEGLAAKAMGDRNGEQAVIAWRIQHPNDPITSAPLWIQELDAAARNKGRTPYDQAWERIRALPGGLSDPNANPLDVQTTLKGLGQEPKAMTESQLIARYDSDAAFRASLDPTSRGMIDELRKGKGAGAVNNIKFYDNYVSADVALTTARHNLVRAHTELERIRGVAHGGILGTPIGAGFTPPVGTKKDALSVAAAAVSKAQSAFDAALDKRDVEYTVYKLAERDAGRTPPPIGTIGSPRGNQPAGSQPPQHQPGERVDKNYENHITDWLGKNKAKPKAGQTLGDAVFNGTEWVWK